MAEEQLQLVGWALTKRGEWFNAHCPVSHGAAEKGNVQPNTGIESHGVIVESEGLASLAQENAAAHTGVKEGI